MPLALRSRATICPKRPKPATITGWSAPSMVSMGRAGPASARRSLGSMKRSCSPSRIGVVIMDRATTPTRSPLTSVRQGPGAVAAENRTKANSPPWDRTRAKDPALGFG